MAVPYSNAEQTDMILVLGYCDMNCRESVRVYRERFPNRRLPNRQTFANIERRLRENGQFAPINVNRGRPPVRNVDIENRVLDCVEENPGTSTRNISRQLVVPKSTVNRVLRRQLLHPYHIQKVQDILPFDPEARLSFCHIIRQLRHNDVNFHQKILFTDESCFTRNGITNIRNDHHYADENPHATKVAHHQHQFKINVWMGIISDNLIGPIEMPERLNGDNYLEFLRTIPELLEDVPLELRRSMWFMHDGAPPHFALNVRAFLNRHYPNRWIGRGEDAPIKWPARSPDLTPCDFFVWGTLKTNVYKTPVATRAELWRRIVHETNLLKNNREMLGRVNFNFMKRVNACVRENGEQFQHLLG